MEFGEICLKTWRDYRKRCLSLLGISFYSMILFFIFFYVLIITKELGSIISFLLSIFYIIIQIGVISSCFKIAKDEKIRFSDLFIGFSKKIGKLLLIEILHRWIVFLWGLALVIPGVVKRIAYSQIFYIFLEKPYLKVSECLKESDELMNGYKTSYFKIEFLLGIIFILFILPLISLTEQIENIYFIGDYAGELIFSIAGFIFFPIYNLFRANIYIAIVKDRAEEIQEEPELKIAG
ncbi:hypothetical protein [Sebaldella sp. S0638]|uniref:hypothetical protein n=1 Tax=Sebaldella sp. S0638 TaxID=2957809 RepID=UPI00209DFBC1|nr:hypothetical protein [Sebaldella sp. S0638]MCP1223418.1 hypothetical protein [Sebaldella sp. S0638]